MKMCEMYAATSDGNYSLVRHADNVERKRYMIAFPDGLKIQGCSLFFNGHYEGALRAWEERSDAGIKYQSMP